MLSKSVTVHLRGGLGNQLFQYGAGYALSKRDGRQLIIDGTILPEVHKKVAGVSHWPEQISLFENGSSKVRKTGSAAQIFWKARGLQYLRLLSQRSNGLLNTFANESGEYSPHFENLSGKNIHINSYCNDVKFFLGFDEEIRQRISSPIRQSNSLALAKLEAVQAKPVALHVRLGDYKNLSHVYGKFDPTYFYRAVALMKDLVGEKPIWLFSDEPEQAKELLPELQGQLSTPSFISDLSGYETLLAMSESVGIVGSSSSFSWWGSFLGQKPGFRAIFPRPTFAVGGPVEPKSSLLQDWIQIGRSV